MALKIRLRQMGKRNQIVYRLVLSDSRSPRDGKYIELLGWYNPMESEPEKNLNVNANRVLHWLNHGAILSEKAEKLVFKGAPEVMEGFKKKQLATRLKYAEKKKAARSKKAEKKAEQKSEPKKSAAPKAKSKKSAAAV